GGVSVFGSVFFPAAFGSAALSATFSGFVSAVGVVWAVSSAFFLPPRASTPPTMAPTARRPPIAARISLLPDDPAGPAASRWGGGKLRDRAGTANGFPSSAGNSSKRGAGFFGASAPQSPDG